MKAVVLAAGRGTRMRHLTEEMPKPMLPVRGRPILEHILLSIRQAGIEEVCIVTRYRAEVIESYFGDGGRLGLRIRYARQGEEPGTGKAAAAAAQAIGQAPFLLVYGDVLVDPRTYPRVLERFREGSFDGLLTVIAREDVHHGGLAWFDDRFRLLGLVEKPSPDQIQELIAAGHIQPQGPFWYNAGIYIFQPVVFEYLARLTPSPRGEYELTDAVRAMLQDGRSIAGLALEGSWVDVRDPETLERLNRV